MGDYYHLTLFADLEQHPDRDALIERLRERLRGSSHYHGGTSTFAVEHYRTQHGDDVKRLTLVAHIKYGSNDKALELIKALEPFLRRHGLMGYLCSQTDSIDVIWNDYDRGVMVGSVETFEQRNNEDSEQPRRLFEGADLRKVGPEEAAVIRERDRYRAALVEIARICSEDFGFPNDWSGPVIGKHPVQTVVQAALDDEGPYHG